MARKILLADDSVTAQNMGRKILADAGYEVIAVNNGSAALKKIAELKPDLVILDVYMPGYSGLEVCQRLKESQETARIPVLLTVGKLEPFKPEEAQRVRAEGYIVKPFEASELLSALSKLEDKVVPRAEPSKPGRFAKAMAAVDETDRRNEPSSTETGWKNRIAFPNKKTEAQEAERVAEDLAAEENAAGKNKKEKEKRRPAAEAAETNVDLAAFAPVGLPKDVTSAEVAAITAAAAQIQIAGAAARNEHPISEASSEFSVEPALERFQDSGAEEIQASSGAGHHMAAAEAGSSSNEPGNAAGVSSALPTAELDRRDLDRRNGNQRLEETPDAPVTMAATSESSRWTAVPVALGGDETSMSLDHEMQKAYAAFAAADYATSAGTVEREIAPSESSAPPETKTNQEALAPAISNSEPAAVPEPQPVPVEASPANIEAPETADGARLDDDDKLASVPQFMSPAGGTDVAASAPGVPAPATESPAAPAAIASTDALTPIASDAAPKLDSEAVKTTAAAWASWRQVRDDTSRSNSNSNEKPETQPQESAAPESASSDTAALAVAAGAEQALREASSAAPSGSPPDVASIVDSVLADLRPKLMEEISRKMAEKK